MKKFGIACAFICLSASALADGFYVAADLGQVKWDFDVATTDKTSLAVAGGYKFSLPFKDTMAVELGYRQLGVHNDKDALYAYRSEFNALQLSVIASHSFSPQLSAYGRLGVAQLDIDWRATRIGAPNIINKESVTKDRVFYGVGARYTFSEKLSARLEYSYLNWEDVRFTGPSLGLEYSF
ncbi:hypothetical protein GCM10011613_03940 [Cellvibrio zantedeschiae]|uniref:Outer membrane protein beta-barrel domain-containing protein n=1 Tax=Cellvibrio zantedeschiae TaxID=1237077 RepID=A0ABQ3ARV9_9GAMM|nr:porin family protein [Cellvibrio zantedeschiae]GGY63447.1 hypothetical protein GCM10011613_03940 [Cellvibrio zantedeschiae]